MYPAATCVVLDPVLRPESFTHGHLPAGFSVTGAPLAYRLEYRPNTPHPARQIEKDSANYVRVCRQHHSLLSLSTFLKGVLIISKPSWWKERGRVRTHRSSQREPDSVAKVTRKDAIGVLLNAVTSHKRESKIKPEGDPCSDRGYCQSQEEELHVSVDNVLTQYIEKAKGLEGHSQSP
jgi:hypothetical protein